MRRSFVSLLVLVVVAACSSSPDADPIAREEQALAESCATRCLDECGHDGACISVCVKMYCGCAAGTANCDDTRSNGCETNISGDVSNCGACRNECPNYPNASSSCTEGTCGWTCNTGYADCDGVATNGCEIDLTGDTANCGACGNVCPGYAHATPTCGGGVCGSFCTAGYADCDHVATNGCESALATDAANCGGCGRVCPSHPNEAASCTNGGCVSTCNAGYSDCDLNSTNGCEISGACAVDPPLFAAGESGAAYTMTATCALTAVGRVGTSPSCCRADTYTVTTTCDTSLREEPDAAGNLRVVVDPMVGCTTTLSGEACTRSGELTRCDASGLVCPYDTPRGGDPALVVGTYARRLIVLGAGFAPVNQYWIPGCPTGNTGPGGLPTDVCVPPGVFPTIDAPNPILTTLVRTGPGAFSIQRSWGPGQGCFAPTYMPPPVALPYETFASGWERGGSFDMTKYTCTYSLTMK